MDRILHFRNFRPQAVVGAVQSAINVFLRHLDALRGREIEVLVSASAGGQRVHLVLEERQFLHHQFPVLFSALISFGLFGFPRA